MWNTAGNGSAIGTIGSEGGIILFDEEYKNRCRITLEKTMDRFAITCGDYSGMCHTVFANIENYMDKYQSIKKDLAEFIDKDIQYPECLQFYDEFINRY